MVKLMRSIQISLRQVHNKISKNNFPIFFFSNIQLSHFSPIIFLFAARFKLSFVFESFLFAWNFQKKTTQSIDFSMRNKYVSFLAILQTKRKIESKLKNMYNVFFLFCYYFVKSLYLKLTFECVYRFIALHPLFFVFFFYQVCDDSKCLLKLQLDFANSYWDYVLYNRLRKNRKKIIF